MLSELFHAAAVNEINKICYMLLGRVAPLFEAIEFGVADKFMIRAIMLAYHVSEKKVISEFKKLGDIGASAEKCYRVLEHRNNSRVAIEDVYKQLYELAITGGIGSQEKKITMLANLLSSVDSLSARYIARIPLDKLRLGLSDMTMLDAISWMESGNKSVRDKLEEAYNVRPDIGYIALQVKEHGMKGLSHVKAKVGAPILASLCQRLPTAEEMIEKMQKVIVEPKFDGERVQIHYKKLTVNGERFTVNTYSRNLENITAMFPELSHIEKQIHATEAIFDAEAVGLNPETRAYIPFQETMTRKRKHGIAQAQLLVPLKFVVFDMLYKDGNDLLATPLYQRKKMLEQTITTGDTLVVSPQIVTNSPDRIRAYHDEQIQQGLEGVVVKKWESGYEPGRRGFSWVKFKEEEGKTGKLTDTIDAVIMGYTSGEGKRTQFGIGQMLLGVKDGEEFVTVSKLGSGATEEELRMFFRVLKKITVREKPNEYKNVHKLYTPDVWVMPKIVVEVAGDDLTRSKSHGAGIAIRFPRLVRIREDKSPSGVTTVTEIKDMYEKQGGRI